MAQNAHTYSGTHTGKWAVPATLLGYQGQRRFISVARGCLSKRRHKHNHNSSKCRHFYSSGSCRTGAWGGQRACVFSGRHALLVASRKSWVSCRLLRGWRFVDTLAGVSRRSTPGRFVRLHWNEQAPHPTGKTPSKNQEQEKGSSFPLVTCPTCPPPTHNLLQESVNLLFLLVLLLLPQLVTHSEQVKERQGSLNLPCFISSSRHDFSLARMMQWQKNAAHFSTPF